MIETTDTMFGLQSDWAILAALFILTSVQIVQVVINGTRVKREKSEKERQSRVLDNIEMYLQILSNKYTEEVTERQLPIIIREFLGHCKESIMVIASTAITRNDVINNEREIRSKLTQLINNSFQTLRVDLSLFKWKGRLLAEFLNNKWSVEVVDKVTDIVITVTRRDKDEAYRQLGTLLNSKFDYYKTETLSAAYEV